VPAHNKPICRHDLRFAKRKKNNNFVKETIKSKRKETKAMTYPP